MAINNNPVPGSGRDHEVVTWNKRNKFTSDFKLCAPSDQ